MNTTDYLAELRTSLADLPRAEVDAIVEDVTPQLAERGPDGLGTPAEYAAELRAAAGLPARQGGLGPRVAVWVLAFATGTAGYGGYLNAGIASNDARYSMPFIGLALIATWFIVGRLGRDVRPVAELPELRLALAAVTGVPSPVRRYLASLQPAWVLLRAALVGLGVLLLCHTIGWFAGMPELVAVGVAAIVVGAGVRARTDRRWLWLSIPAGAWAVGVALWLLHFVPLIVDGHIGYLG